MALYDSKFDWYDLLVPGSTLPATMDVVNSATNYVGKLSNNISGVTSQQEFNSAEAQKQRDFETQMSNTSYQRAVSDMNAAGLNSALLYSNGASSASTPVGHSASSNVSGGVIIPALINSAGTLINSFTNAKNSGINNYNAETKRMLADTQRHYLDYSTRSVANSAAALMKIAKHIIR